jgi:hypothetical protein
MSKRTGEIVAVSMPMPKLNAQAHAASIRKSIGRYVTVRIYQANF